MKHELKIVWAFAALLLVVTAIALVLLRDAEAETALPEPLIVVGDLRLSDAPVSLSVAACVRVDVVSVSADGAWAELKLPYVPPSISDVLLFDGWHILHASWERIDENTLRLHVNADDLATLDGSVGVYLVILAEVD